MIDLSQFRDEVLRPTLRHLDKVDPGQDGPAAERLLLGTLVAESAGRHLRQLGGGPALSLFQIELRTHDDIHANWLAYRPRLADAIADLAAPWPRPLVRQLAGNLAYAAAVARQVYRRAPDPLPAPGDADDMAGYWKAIYNTPLGAGVRARFAASFRAHVLPLYAASEDAGSPIHQRQPI